MTDIDLDKPVSIRIPKAVRKQVRKRAKAEGDSESGWIRRAVIRQLAAPDARNQAA